MQLTVWSLVGETEGCVFNTVHTRLQASRPTCSMNSVHTSDNLCTMKAPRSCELSDALVSSAWEGDVSAVDQGHVQRWRTVSFECHQTAGNLSRLWSSLVSWVHGNTVTHCCRAEHGVFCSALNNPPQCLHCAVPQSTSISNDFLTILCKCVVVIELTLYYKLYITTQSNARVLFKFI